MTTSGFFFRSQELAGWELGKGKGGFCDLIKVRNQKGGE